MITFRCQCGLGLWYAANSILRWPDFLGSKSRRSSLESWKEEECRPHLGYRYKPSGKPGISFPFLTSASYSSVIPWKSGPKWPYQTAFTTCCVISFKVTLVYNLILALHSFGVACVSIFQGSFCPAHASYRNSRLQENVSNEAASSSTAVPGAARPAWGRNALGGEHQAVEMIFLLKMLSLETCVKQTKHSSSITSA